VWGWSPAIAPCYRLVIGQLFSLSFLTFFHHSSLSFIIPHSPSSPTLSPPTSPSLSTSPPLSRSILSLAGSTHGMAAPGLDRRATTVVAVPVRVSRRRLGLGLLHRP